MDLKRYRGEGGCSPRNNPKGRQEAPGNRFVIQKHQANSFHFDFRLEIIDKDNNLHTLHSWIIPKNIPLEPDVKHLAIKTKKRALNLLDLDGGILEGDFGKGQIDIWDKGRWGLMKGKIKDGFISFNLFGSIIKSRYAMQKVEEEKGKKNHWVIWKTVGF